MPLIDQDTPELITRTEQLVELAGKLRNCPAVAVDTESNSLYAYREQVCLVQFSTRQADYLVDALFLADLSPLAEVFADPGVEKVFHAAEYDLICLRRDFGFEFNHIFDTMLAARMLGRAEVGLGSLLEAEFGVKLDKKFQRANWGARPLTTELLNYARLDTHYLLGLRQRLGEELERSGLSLLAEEDFARMARGGAVYNDVYVATPEQGGGDCFAKSARNDRRAVNGFGNGLNGLGEAADDKNGFLSSDGAGYMEVGDISAGHQAARQEGETSAGHQAARREGDVDVGDIYVERRGTEEGVFPGVKRAKGAAPVEPTGGRRTARRGAEQGAAQEVGGEAGQVATPGNGRGADWWRMAGASKLTPRQAAILNELCKYRDQTAQALNRPLFKVMGDRTLVAIALAAPGDLRALSQVPGMTQPQMRRSGRGLLAAVKRGLKAPGLRMPRLPRPDGRYLKRLRALKEWRTETADRLGVPSDVVLPRDLLLALAEANPRQAEELGRVLRESPYRMQNYGEQILQALKRI